MFVRPTSQPLKRAQPHSQARRMRTATAFAATAVRTAARRITAGSAARRAATTTAPGRHPLRGGGIGRSMRREQHVRACAAYVSCLCVCVCVRALVCGEPKTRPDDRPAASFLNTVTQQEWAAAGRRRALPAVATVETNYAPSPRMAALFMGGGEDDDDGT